ncbi:right-handed parallel beta-helix repeat-containing protein, partial [bacterium]|nr:right-handed parallel beta-helix repeat-containing protein [bacterium]
MKKGKFIVKIFGIALVSLVIGVTFPVTDFASQSQALAGEVKTWYVDDDRKDYPEADFTKIGDALAAATAGDTIIVHSGTFYENLILNKTIVLKGIGYPVIDGRGNNVIAITADSNCIQGFKLVNGGHHPNWPAAGIWVKSNNNVIESNIIESNRNGIKLSDANYNIIRRNKIYANDNDGVSLGDSLSKGSHYNEISRNDICSNG